MMDYKQESQIDSNVMRVTTGSRIKTLEVQFYAAKLGFNLV